MIKIETVLDILKKDHNFRDIVKDGEYFFSYSGLTFDSISYDSREADASTLFFVKGEAFKKEFLEQLACAFISARQTFKWAFRFSWSTMSSKP